MMKKENRVPTPRSAVNRFAKITGMHGVPNIYVSRHWALRIIWTLLTLTMTGLTIWQLIVATDNFRSSPVSTSISYVYASPMNFPAVTICNLNPFRYHQLRNYDKDPSIRRILTQLGNQTTSSTVNSTDTAGMAWDSRDKVNRRSDAMEYSVVFESFSSLSPELASNLSYPINDILIDCSFNERNCVPNDFIPVRTVRFGMCYTFNSGMLNNKSSTSIRQVTKTGSQQHGLQLTLFVGQSNYIPKVVTDAGYKVLIHSQNIPPLPQSNGYEVSPGFMTSFGIRTIINERASSPYGPCKNFTAAENASMNHMLDQLPLTSPTTEVCMQVCEQLLLLRRCNCFSYRDGLTSGPPFQTLNQKHTMRPCTEDAKSEDGKCMAKVIRNSSNQCMTNQCQFKECIDVRYPVTPALSRWPAEGAYQTLLKSIETHPQRKLLKRLNNKTSDEVKAFISENFVKINIFFQTLEIEYILTESSYPLITFIGDIGGITGLWLGFSILTFFELIEFICHLLLSFFYCGHSRRSDHSLSLSAIGNGYDHGDTAENSRPWRRETESNCL